jgi:hypothetical protein
VKCIDEEDKIMCLANGAQVLASSVRFIEGLTPSYHSLMTCSIPVTEKDVILLDDLSISTKYY